MHPKVKFKCFRIPRKMKKAMKHARFTHVRDHDFRGAETEIATGIYCHALIARYRMRVLDGHKRTKWVRKLGLLASRGVKKRFIAVRADLIE